MKTTKILTILLMFLEMMVFMATPTEAALMGTAFTYQGRLIDANNTADGLYDFQFKLYDDPNAGSQKGGDVNIADLDVIDGYFTVELDFGSGIFDGNDRWLEIGVRAGELSDPNAYIILSPRQGVTPTPYAMYAKSGTPGPQGEQGPVGPQGIPGPTLGIYDSLGLGSSGGRVAGDAGGRTLINLGNVGIGTMNPGAQLEVAGQVKVTGGDPASGKVLTSDATGLATWQALPSSGVKRIIRGVISFNLYEVELSQNFSPAIDPSKSFVFLSDALLQLNHLRSYPTNYDHVLIGTWGACLISLTGSQITVRISDYQYSGILPEQYPVRVSYQIVEYN